MSYFSVVHHESGGIRTRCARRHTVEHVYDSERELCAVVLQREPVACQRDGLTGLIQTQEDCVTLTYRGVTLGKPWVRFERLPEAMTGSVYGLIPVKPEPADRNPLPSAEPLPVDCPASDYVSEFRDCAAKFATRSLWKVRRQSGHVDADDIANDAVLLLLDDPARYALDPISAGASQAVNDAIRNEQGSELKRSVKFEPLTIDCGLSAPVETIPSDYETEADALAKLVGNSLAIHAALVANQVENEVSADAFGVSVRTIERRRADIRKCLVHTALSAIVGQFAIM